MDLVTGAMGNLVPKLLQLLGDEYKLQKGVKKQVKFVSEEMESIRAALHKVGKVPPDQLDEPVRIWASQVREASYDMEDVLDTFLVRVEGNDKPTGDHGRLKRAMKKMGALFSKGKARHDIAGIIEDIKEQLEEVAKRRDRYRIDEIVPKAEGETSVDPRLSALYTEASKLVGINEPKEALIEMLSIVGKDVNKDTCGRNKKKKIVSVVGSGGLGKTTLAKVVYDQVKLQFDCCGFVPVGQNPVPKKILGEILVELIDNEYERGKYNRADQMGLQAEDLIREQRDFLQGKRYTKYTRDDLMRLEAPKLINEIREFLQGKRYIIVVDDIWDIKTWENIKLAFVDSNSGSRIVTTSRNFQISEKIGDEVYRINKLSDQNSRKLFCARVSDKKGDTCPDIDNLDEVSDKIIKKCDGVPLVIIAVASMLDTKPRNQWSDVYKSIGFGHDGDNIEASNMKKILSFSYYDLPCEIRTCMLYLSVFPEDHSVCKYELIWKWIAEGLVPTQVGKGLFEVGEGYFHELVNRGLILPSVDRSGMVLGCRVHDFILDLICELSREQNFVITVAGSEQEQRLSLPGGGKVRRLALQNISKYNINDCLPVKVEDQQKAVARSFHAIYSNMIDHISLAGFKHLRVLSLECCRLDEGYLEDIGKLHHLRYLGLIQTPVGELPEGVGNLKFLQTLMLKRTGIKELPETLEDHTGLMCLRADVTTGVPDWIGKMTSLEDLAMYPDASSAGRFVKELGKLRRLRFLLTEIDLQDQGQASDFLESLSKLREIEIVNVGIRSKAIYLTEEDVKQQPAPVLDFKKNNLRVLILNALGFPRLPAWINPGALPKLCRLSLLFNLFEQQDMEILGGFPNLRSLQIVIIVEGLTRNGNIVTCGDGGFQNLQTFDFTAYDQTMMKFAPGAMPRLGELRFLIGLALDKEARLVLDYGLGSLRSLERVDATILCSDCFPSEIEAVEAAVRNQVLSIRPNNPPTLSMRRFEEEDTPGTIHPERMLTRQSMEKFSLRNRCRRVGERFRKQFIPFFNLIEASKEILQDWSRRGSCYGILLNKARRIWEECTDALGSAFHGQILRCGGVDDAETWKQFWTQFKAKWEETIQFVHQKPDVHKTMDHIASLERGIDVLMAADYQRLAAMWEEVQAQHSLMVQWRTRHIQLCIDFDTIELLPVDGMKLQVLQFMDQWYDTTDLAFHGRILWRSELSAEDHRDYRQEIHGFWEKCNRKQDELFRFEPHRDIEPTVREHIAALKAPLDKLTAEYPRLKTMWEELTASENGLLPAIVREKELRKRLRQQLRQHDILDPDQVDKLLAIDAKKARRYLYQFWDMLEHAMHEQILWRSELGDEDHPDYCIEGRARVMAKLKASIEPLGPYRDVHQVTANIAVKEAMLEKLTIEYPRLTAIFEGLKAELFLPAAKDEADTMASNVTVEPEEQQHCLYDQ